MRNNLYYIVLQDGFLQKDYNQNFYNLLYVKNQIYYNPGAEILCILGVMGEALNTTMEAAVSDYKAETGDEKIRSLTLREQDGKRNGYGADWHPSEQTQRELADIVTEAVRPLCPGNRK